MKTNFTYRQANENDFEGILSLYNAMYKSDRSLKDWRWLVKDNPAGQAILFIALEEHTIVGMQSLIPYMFYRDGKWIKTYKSEDTLVLNRLRGQGIFSQLYKMVHEYVGDLMVWGLTDKKNILTKVSMPSSYRLSISVLVGKPTIFKNNKGMHRLIAKSILYTYFYFMSRSRINKNSSSLNLQTLNIEDIQWEKWDSFFNKIANENPKILIPKMDSSYLKWRLKKNPNFDSYKIYVSLNFDGEIEICSLIGFKSKSAYWLSIYSRNNCPKNEIVGHVNMISNLIFESGFELIHSWLFSCNDLVSQQKENFREAGFGIVRDGLWIVHNTTEKKISAHDLYFSSQLGIR